MTLKTLVLSDDIGRITLVCTVTEATAALPMYAAAIEVDAPVNMDAMYVADGTLQARPACPAVLQDGVLTDLPVPCRIIIDGTAYACDEPVAELALDAGRHTVLVQAFPYRDGVFEVTV